MLNVWAAVALAHHDRVLSRGRWESGLGQGDVVVITLLHSVSAHAQFVEPYVVVLGFWYKNPKLEVVDEWVYLYK